MGQHSPDRLPHHTLAAAACVGQCPPFRRSRSSNHRGAGRTHHGLSLTPTAGPPPCSAPPDSQGDTGPASSCVSDHDVHTFPAGSIIPVLLLLSDSVARNNTNLLSHGSGGQKVNSTSLGWSGSRQGCPFRMPQGRVCSLPFPAPRGGPRSLPPGPLLHCEVQYPSLFKSLGSSCLPLINSLGIM